MPRSKLNPNFGAIFFRHALLFIIAFALLQFFPRYSFLMCVFIFILGIIFNFYSYALAFLSGLLLGDPLGILGTLAGYALSLSFLFGLTRQFGLDIPMKFRKKHERTYWFIHEPFKNDFKWAAQSRFVPVIPEDDLNLAAGATQCRFFPYLFGSLTGLLPAILIFPKMGHSLKKIWATGSMNLSWPGVILWMLGIILLSVPVFYRHMDGWGSEQ